MSPFRRVDPRLWVLANNTILLVVGMELAGLQRDPVQVASTLALALATELVCARISRKHPRFDLRDRAISACAAAISTLVLLRSDRPWFHAAIASAAILSKYVIVDERGRHVFNPTNVAIVGALAFLPNFVSVRPDDYSAWLGFRLMIPLFGLCAALGGARFRCTLGLRGLPGVTGRAAGVVLGVKPLWIVMPELNTSTMIFAFLMMTDPRTSPASPRGQLAFGACVALVHHWMRWSQIPFSPFVALFAVTAARSALRPREAAATA